MDDDLKKQKEKISFYLEQLRTGDPCERFHAVHSLGEACCEVMVGPLTQAMKDSSADVRREAVICLGAIRNEAAVRVLVQALQDVSRLVRCQAVETLTQVGVPTVEALKELLDHEDTELRTMVTHTLGKIGGEKAALALCSALDDGNVSVRRAAVKSLGKIGGTAVIPQLEQLKDDHNHSH